MYNSYRRLFARAAAAIREVTAVARAVAAVVARTVAAVAEVEAVGAQSSYPSTVTVLGFEKRSTKATLQKKQPCEVAGVGEEGREGGRGPRNRV